MIIDTHAHYDDERFDEDRDTLLKGMRESGVERGQRVEYFQSQTGGRDLPERSIPLKNVLQGQWRQSVRRWSPADNRWRTAQDVAGDMADLVLRKQMRVHDEVRRAGGLVFAEIVDAHNRVALQIGGDPGLAGKTVANRFVSFGDDRLDGDTALQDDVFRKVDHAHSALAQKSHNDIFAAKSVTGRKMGPWPRGDIWKRL